MEDPELHLGCNQRSPCRLPPVNQERRCETITGQVTDSIPFPAKINEWDPYLDGWVTNMVMAHMEMSSEMSCEQKKQARAAFSKSYIPLPCSWLFSFYFACFSCLCNIGCCLPTRHQSGYMRTKVEWANPPLPVQFLWLFQSCDTMTGASASYIPVQMTGPSPQPVVINAASKSSSVSNLLQAATLVVLLVNIFFMVSIGLFSSYLRHTSSKYTNKECGWKTFICKHSAAPLAKYCSMIGACLILISPWTWQQF